MRGAKVEKNAPRARYIYKCVPHFARCDKLTYRHDCFVMCDELARSLPYNAWNTKKQIYNN